MGQFGTNNLRAKFEPKSDGPMQVTLAGAIDENSDLDSVFSRLTEDAVLNMRDVERINSMGVHYWIPLVTRAASQHRIVIEEISYAIVQNAVAVANMFGAAEVRSCMAPYFCASCKNNFTVTVTRDEVAEAAMEPPPKHCDRCKSAMEFDELDGYFSFFKARKGT